MAIANFYSPELCKTSTVIELSEEESRHAMKSRRLSAGSKVTVLNGRGLIGFSHITELSSRKRVLVKVDRIQHQKNDSVLVTIASAIAKGDRQKVMIDALTQLGVSQIIPIECDYSVTKYKDTMLAKWQKIVIESAKQSQNAWFPKVLAPVSLEQLISSFDGRIFYADQQGGYVQPSDVKQSAKACYPLIVCIGPEGGFSVQEKNHFQDNLCTPIKLAPHILRIEVAAVTAMSQLLNY